MSDGVSEKDLAKLINDISVLMRLARAMQEFGNETGSLTERELIILEMLESAPKRELTLSDVSKLFRGVAQSTLSTEVTKLRDKGWIEKGIDPNNERARTVRASPIGREALQESKKNSEKRYSLLLKAIRADEDERRVLAKVLGKAIGYIDQRIHEFVGHSSEEDSKSSE